MESKHVTQNLTFTVPNTNFLFQLNSDNTFELSFEKNYNDLIKDKKGHFKIPDDNEKDVKVTGTYSNEKFYGKYEKSKINPNFISLTLNKTISTMADKTEQTKTTDYKFYMVLISNIYLVFLNKEITKMDLSLIPFKNIPQRSKIEPLSYSKFDEDFMIFDDDLWEKINNSYVIRQGVDKAIKTKINKNQIEIEYYYREFVQCLDTDLSDKIWHYKYTGSYEIICQFQNYYYLAISYSSIKQEADGLAEEVREMDKFDVAKIRIDKKEINFRNII